MSLFASEIEEFVRKHKEGLGTSLAGRFADVEVDSVEAVRKIREE